MQIKIEIDVKPEELRRFLGLPDVSGLQDEIIAFLRDKVEAASEFDAGGFVKSNIDAIKNIVAKVTVKDATAESETERPRRSRRKTQDPE
ncbi:MAG: hypothetical protein E6R07_00835 [Nevskiaceae bacterium]|nr:MAG: hypothetical protein E6R07_00835 [Nevskiaceae bacterium]